MMLLAASLAFTASCADANFRLTKGQQMTQETGNLPINLALGSLVKVGKYKGLELHKKAMHPIDDADVITRMSTEAGAFKNTALTDDTNHIVENADIINLDFEGFVDGASKSLDSTTAKGFLLGIGSGNFIPGFEKQLIGHKVGEEKFDINLTFPANYHAKEMAGKPARFEIKINGVLTDKDVEENTDFKTIDEWKNDIKTKITQEQDNSNMSSLKNEAMIALGKVSMVRRVPEDLLKEYIHELEEYLYKPYAEQMGMEYDEMKETYGLDDEVIRVNAQNNMALDMIVCSIAKKEKLTVTAEELKEKKESMIGEGKAFADEKEYTESNGDETLIKNILSDKVAQLVVDNAKIVEVSEQEYDNLMKQGQVEAPDEEDDEDMEVDTEDDETSSAEVEDDGEYTDGDDVEATPEDSEDTQANAGN